MGKSIRVEGTAGAKALRWSKPYMVQEQQGSKCAWRWGSIGEEICVANQLQSLGISDPRQQHCL